MITVIECGCAECYWVGDDEPLINIVQLDVDTIEEAKAKYTAYGWLTGEWTPHPQGGEHATSGQGSVWILPVEGLAGVRAQSSTD